MTDGQADIRELEHKAGQGNWGAFRKAGLDLRQVTDIAGDWRRQIEGVARPWLCWNVSEEWCFVQQSLAEMVGWTPVVGFDPRVGPPRRLSPNARVINFNEGINLPVMYPHFPVEFAFLFCDRLAFWHSDLLVRPQKLGSLAAKFAALPPGHMFATKASNGFRHIFDRSRKRHWELIGCTTREASRSQFEQGCGWWMEFWNHPNCPNEPERLRRAKYYWDHGSGIYFWDLQNSGRVSLVTERYLREGHFTKIGNPNYIRSYVSQSGSDAQRSMNAELHSNFSLAAACEALGIDLKV